MLIKLLGQIRYFRISVNQILSSFLLPGLVAQSDCIIKRVYLEKIRKQKKACKTLKS